MSEQKNWPSYFNGKKKVSGAAAALHYIKEITKEGHFRGLLEETYEDGYKDGYKDAAKKYVNEKFDLATKSNIRRVK